VLRRLEYQWQVLAVIAIGTFMVILDTTIVNIALPRIITVFGSPVDQAQLVITGYMLALATIVPAAPYFSQTFGSKRMYLITLALFTLGSALCGLAWSVPSLVLFRVVQGLGGGMIGPIGMAMLFRVTPPEQRGSPARPVARWVSGRVRRLAVGVLPQCGAGHHRRRARRAVAARDADRAWGALRRDRLRPGGLLLGGRAARA
jgi:MFS family permease